MRTRTPLQLPGFEKQVVFAAQQALEAWREEALTGEHPALGRWCQPLLVASLVVTLRAALQYCSPAEVVIVRHPAALLPAIAQTVSLMGHAQPVSGICVQPASPGTSARHRPAAVAWVAHPVCGPSFRALPLALQWLKHWSPWSSHT